MTATVATRRPVRLGPVSLVWRPRAVLICVGLLVALFLLSCADLTLGDYPLSMTDVAATLFGAGDPVDRLVVVDLRLPRVLVAIGVGAALAMSGAIVQSVTRNPLASPDVLGITTGSGAAAVGAIVLGAGGTGWAAGVGLPLAALLGGLVTGLLIFTLSWTGGLDGFRVILVGIGVNAALVSLTSLLLINARITEAAQATVWLTGSLADREWTQVRALWVMLVLAAVVALACAHSLGALRFSEDCARALGLRVDRARTLVVLAAVVLAAAAAAAAGPIAFVAFAVPQIMKRLLRTAGEPLVGSAIGGAVLLVGADVVARNVLPVALPVGIVTAVVGAPYFLYVVHRSRQVHA